MMADRHQGCPDDVHVRTAVVHHLNQLSPEGGAMNWMMPHISKNEQERDQESLATLTSKGDRIW
jgi:hypothetical protein